MRTVMADADTLTFEHDGAERVRSALSAVDLRRVKGAVAGLQPDQAGIRLHGIKALRGLLSSTGSVGGIAASILRPACIPVRAILFDKTLATNWSLTWHQDRTIVVHERQEVDGFGPWTVKSGPIHVQPPFELLARMVTIRVHLDAVPGTNALLLIAPGPIGLAVSPKPRSLRL